MSARRPRPGALAVFVCGALASPADAAGAPTPGSVEPTPRPRVWRARGGGRMSLEVRGEASGILFPSRDFDVPGSCATGTGVAPVSIYGPAPAGPTTASGLGVGARVGYGYMSTPKPDRNASWWALRASAGIDVALLYTQTPTISPASGELCTEYQKRGREVDYGGSAAILFQQPLSLGGQVGLGAFRSATTWRGVALGASWSPTIVYVGAPGDGLAFRPLAAEVSLDVATLDGIDERRALEGQLRVAVFFSPPANASEPLIATLSVGAVWY